MTLPEQTTPLLIEIPYRTDSALYVEQILHLPDCIFFDSGHPAPQTPAVTQVGRYDIFSAAPMYTLRVNQGQLCRYHEDVLVETTDLDAPGQLSQLLDGYIKRHELPIISPAVNLPFYGGLAGYLGYDLQHYLGTVRRRYTAGQDIMSGAAPDMVLGFYPWTGVVDHQERRAWLSFLPDCPRALSNQIRAQLSSVSTTQYNKNKFILNKKLESKLNLDSYIGSIQKIKDYLEAGDCYQINFAREFSGSGQGSSWAAYRNIRKSVSSPFSCYFTFKCIENLSTYSILSFSPERFIQLHGKNVLTQPIKGTAPRDYNPEKDRFNADNLLKSEKNQAENLMIVDLLRNDLGRCCTPGTIRVEKLFELQSFSNVHHLVSTISGRLSDDQTALNLLDATFPGGSVTGTPKARAIEIIDELESFKRSIYCGSLGYININGDMDWNIAIRTLLFSGGKDDRQEIKCWAGGGIVADSDWPQEHQETQDKVNALLRGLE